MNGSMKKLIVPLLATAAALAMATGVAQAQQKKTIALVTNAAADFWTIAGRGLEKAQKEHPEYNIELIVTNEATAAGQRRELDDLLVRGVAGISISVDDAPHATEELNKVAAKTVLITTDSDAPQSKRLAYIGTDNVAAGRQAGEEIKKALPNGGKIALFVGTMDADNARERVQGIKDAIAGTKVELVDVFTDQVDFAKAKANMENVLVKYPDIALLSGLWSYETPLIYDAVKAAGKAGKVKIVGFDEDQRTLRGISDGTIESTVVQQPYEFGYLSATNIIKTLNGDKSWIPADSKLIVPTKVISKSNVAEFTADHEGAAEEVTSACFTARRHGRRASCGRKRRMAETLLELGGISKTYPGVRALDDVSLRVYRGEVLGLIGENGAGKSTLMRVLGGVIAPSEGVIRIGGSDHARMTVSEATRAGIAFVHQELNLFENLDVAANVFIGREKLIGGPLKLVDKRRCAPA